MQSSAWLYILGRGFCRVGAIVLVTDFPTEMVHGARTLRNAKMVDHRIIE